MSYVGKILVVVQVVLSLLFMAFAGAVFTIHANWKQKYETSQQSLQTLQSQKNAVDEELSQARATLTTQLNEQTSLANQFQAQNVSLTTQVATLQQQNNLLEQQREKHTGLAESKANEAKFRQEEAEKLRVEINKLQAKLDETSSSLRESVDQLFTQEQLYSQLNQRYERNLRQSAYLEQVVASNKLETDPDVVAQLKRPAPPVEGLVTQIQKNRTGRVHLVELSIGSDDGLIKGHELDVVRTFETDDPRWLGVVRVVELGPNWAVAEVVLPAKNGIIQDGDNVTTKL